MHRMTPKLPERYEVKCIHICSTSDPKSQIPHPFAVLLTISKLFAKFFSRILHNV